jgi:single-stranded-DNA-specific exonuclease
MPRQEDNELFIDQGMSELESSWRPGLRAFLDFPEIKSYPSIYQKASKMISVLNIRDTQDRLPPGFRLLSCIDMEEAKVLLKELLEKNKLKKTKTIQIQNEVEKRLAAKKDEPIVFEADETFDLNLLGSVASELSNKYGKPVFLLKKMEQESVGTIRSPSGINSVELMKKCQKYLLTFGGHPQASGFRLKNENTDKLKECIIKNLS